MNNINKFTSSVKRNMYIKVIYDKEITQSFMKILDTLLPKLINFYKVNLREVKN